MKSVRFHPEAEEELAAASAWYDEQVDGLGEDLENEIKPSLQKIVQTPLRWRLIGKSTRRYLVARFPYAVVYQNKNNEIYVIAVMHLKRKPFYWRDRI